MIRFAWCCAVPAAVVLVLSWIPIRAEGPATAAVKDEVQAVAQSAATDTDNSDANDVAATIHRALGEKTRVDAAEVPLETLLERLATAHRIQLLIDRQSLLDEGVQLDHPVTIKLPEVTLRSALKLILGPLQLTWVIRDEALTVTTATKAGELLETREYDVRYLLEEDDLSVSDFTELIECMTSSLEPASWDEVGGPGSVREFRRGGALVVRQTQKVHAEIAALLDELARIVQQERGEATPEPELTAEQLAEREIRQRLRQKCSVAFDAQPFQRVLALLADEQRLPLWTDKSALADEGVSYENPVTLRLQNVRLGSALNAILRPLQLTWIIEDEVLKITTQIRADERLVTRVYPVSDLQDKREKLKWPPTGPKGGGFGGSGEGMFSVKTSKQGVGGTSAAAKPGTPVLSTDEIRCTELVEAITSTISPQSWDTAENRSAELTDFDTGSIELITSTISPESWDEVGGPGSVRTFRGALVIRQTQQIHDEIHGLFSRLRKLMTKHAPEARAEAGKTDQLVLTVYHIDSYPVQDLATLIPEVVAPESWKSAGGRGMLYVQPTALVIQQTPDVHQKIVKLLYDVVLKQKK